MIHKIVEIQNVGRYIDTRAPFCNWDGVFGKRNIIYGENRSGKTTFSLILKSSSGFDDLIDRKKSFGVAASAHILLIEEGNKILEYKDGKWNKYLSNIKVFDIHYIEENLYAGYVSTRHNQENMFELILGSQGIELKKKIGELKERQAEIRADLRRLKRLVRKLRSEGKELAVTEIEPEREKIRQHIALYSKQIKTLNIELGLYSKNIFESRAEKVNNYLNIFAPGIQVEKFSKNNPFHYVTFILRVNDTRVYFDNRKGGYAAKYVLSEGDRNAIAFSFFLAELEQDQKLSEAIVVFDDPISSFDYSRKSLTINHLNRLSRRVDQLFLLTHDFIFARDCLKKFDKQTIQLKLVCNASTCSFAQSDIERETLTGVFKDLLIIEEYLQKGAVTEIEKRDIIRCVRPVLEGFLRLKYFRHIGSGEWLGDIIKNIRLSNEGEPLFRLKNYIDDLEDLNDFSKEAHHSNPTYYDSSINDQELRTMIDRLVSILSYI